MRFKLYINITEEDYLDFNKFQTVKSPYAKKQIAKLRIGLLAVMLALVILHVSSYGFTAETFVGLAPFLVLLLLFIIFAPVGMTFTLKASIKTLKKQGKMAYSPTAVMEFYDDIFIETTPTNKTEQKYSSVERVSVVDGKMIYIHINNIAAYMLPTASFESKEQYEDFVSFIKTKCSDVAFY